MEVSEEGRVDALTLGRTASFYYLKHESMRVLSEGLRDGMTVPEVSHVPSFSLGGRPCPVKPFFSRCALTGVVST